MKLGLIERFPIGVYPKIGSSWLKGAAHWGENRIFFQREKESTVGIKKYTVKRMRVTLCVFSWCVFSSPTLIIVCESCGSLGTEIDK